MYLSLHPFGLNREVLPSFLQMLGIMVADPFYAVIGKFLE